MVGALEVIAFPVGVGHFGFNHAGGNQVGTDTLRAVVTSQAACHADQASFYSGIRTAGQAAGDTKDRTDIDDGGTRLHDRNGFAAKAKRRF